MISLCLQVTQMPRSRDLAIFVVTTEDKLIALSLLCICTHRVIIMIHTCTFRITKNGARK